MKIKKIDSSRINSIDFENLNFGAVFSDHMFTCDYVDGKWINPEIIPYQPISVSPASRVFHYGQACFEGMKAFKDDNNDVWLFRPNENYNRIIKSSVRLAMPKFPEELFFEGLNTLLKMDAQWIKPGIGNSLYIRPFIYASGEGFHASPADGYTLVIATAPSGAKFP